MMQGLADGIKNAARKVTDAAKNVWEKTKAGFTSFFQIGSPSKLLARLGGFVMDGLPQGFQDRLGNVLQSVSNIGGRIAGRFAEIAGNITLPGTQATVGDTAGAGINFLRNQASNVARALSLSTNAQASTPPPSVQRPSQRALRRRWMR